MLANIGRGHRRRPSAGRSAPSAVPREHTWVFEDARAWLTAPAAISVVAVFLRVTKRAYGFHRPDALTGMAMLTRGGRCSAPPGRTA